MRLVATEYLSLDGVFEEPGHWSGPWFNDEARAFKWAELQNSDAHLLGRVTYEGFAAAWPTMEGTGEFGEKMNTMPKFVASRTLDRGEWNATIIRGDLAAEVAKLKEQPGRDLLIYGSGDLVDELTRHGLIDEYRLMVHPVIVGSGKRIFNGLTTTTLHLVDTTSTDCGVVVLTYTTAVERD